MKILFDEVMNGHIICSIFRRAELFEQREHAKRFSVNQLDSNAEAPVKIQALDARMLA